MGKKERLVVETDAGRKEALQQLLRERGVTVSDWFEEQLDLLLTERRPSYGETDYGGEADDPISALAKIDWAFAEADTAYLSHDVHPYPAKFIPQIPSTLIGHLSRRGDVVLDTFGGSGTTALEAVRLGRRAISIDANPLAELVGRVKTARLNAKSRAELRSLRALIAGHLVDLPASDACYLDEYSSFVPAIPNVEKWFPPSSRGELALIRAATMRLGNGASDVAALALSRIVISASFQDSETRYASKPRTIPVGTTLNMYLAALDAVIRRVEATSSVVRYGVTSFLSADAKELKQGLLPDCSVDLVVTSPPYGNATDYHLYHRFRLLWLGHDPKELGRVEIGSHLRHQRENTGFDDYLKELLPCAAGIYRILRPGSYAALVIGDSVYGGVTYDTTAALSDAAKEMGFEVSATLERPIHESRRSFAKAARRATIEKLLILRRPLGKAKVVAIAPDYRLWPFEADLRRRELAALGNGARLRTDRGETLPAALAKSAKLLTFTRGIQYPKGFTEPTWQQILENGYEDQQSRRKDPKYVTHGLHPYKGKFYPQLAKSLLNISDLNEGQSVLDPFCGSGTTLLEARLCGYRAVGCDLNPLAAKIARAKVGILDVDPDLVLSAVSAVEEELRTPYKNQIGLDAFTQDVQAEVRSWFAEPVAAKLGTVLSAIRTISTGIVRDYLEVVLSSIIRDVSQQEPRDLRIRRRQEPLEDADVIGLFSNRLSVQIARLEHFWETRGYSPIEFREATVLQGDAREPATFAAMGVEAASIDCVLTSPPYATALPYIDTDRLSLLVIFGLVSRDRRPLEFGLTGSREIATADKRRLENLIESGAVHLPISITEFLVDLLAASKGQDVGFRRRDRASLLLRFFSDMAAVLEQCRRVAREDANIVLVLGDSTTEVRGKLTRIPTTDFVRDIATSNGMVCIEELPIDVTTENLKHVKNAITKNVVLRLKMQ